MALKFNYLRDKGDSKPMETAKVRMFLTADRSRIVGEGDPDAALLYAAPGARLPPDAVERFGLAGGNLPVKQAPEPENKKLKRTRDKRKD